MMPSSPCPRAASAQPSRGMARAKSSGKPLVGRDGHEGLGMGLGQGGLPTQVMQHGSPVQGDGQTQGWASCWARASAAWLLATAWSGYPRSQRASTPER